MGDHLLERRGIAADCKKDTLGFSLTNVSIAFLNSRCIQTSNRLCDLLWFLSVRGNGELRSE